MSRQKHTLNTPYEVARRERLLPVKCWEKVWVRPVGALPGSTYKVQKWVQMDRYQEFSDDENQEAEPAAIVVDEELEDAQRMAAALPDVDVLDEGAASREGSESPEPAPEAAIGKTIESTQLEDAAPSRDSQVEGTTDGLLASLAGVGPEGDGEENFALTTATTPLDPDGAGLGLGSMGLSPHDLSIDFGEEEGADDALNPDNLLNPAAFPGGDDSADIFGSDGLLQDDVMAEDLQNFK